MGHDLTQTNFHCKKQCKTYTREIKSMLKYFFENNFFSYLLSDNNKKLCTYKHFKTRYCSEPYLKYIENPFERKQLTCYRISAHNLKIERGRYQNQERSNRLCTLCNSGEIEDELHFLMNCNYYKDIRQKYLHAIFVDSLLTRWEQFLYLMQTADCDIIRNVSCFLNEAFEKRNATIAIRA